MSSLEIGKLIDENKIKVVVSQTFPLADAAKAQNRSRPVTRAGKIRSQNRRRAEVATGHSHYV